MGLPGRVSGGKVPRTVIEVLLLDSSVDRDAGSAVLAIEDASPEFVTGRNEDHSHGEPVGPLNMSVGRSPNHV